MRIETSGPAGASRATLIWLLAAVALAAGVEIALAARSPVIAKDGVTFIGIAREFARSPIGAIRGADQHPGYPALIVAARRVIGLFGPADDWSAWLLAARLTAMLFGVLNVLVFWAWVRRAFDGRAAGVAAVFFAILPVFCENNADPLSDAPHLFFYLLSAWLITEGLVRRRFSLFPLAGAAGGLAFWIRPDGLAPVCVGAGVIVLLAVFRRERPLTALAWLAGLLIAAGIVAAPYPCLKGKLTSKKDFRVLVSSEAAEPSPAAAQSAPVHAAAQAMGRTGRLAALPRAIGALADDCAHGLRYFLLFPLAARLFCAGAPKAQPRPKLFLAALAGFNILLLILLYLVAGYIGGRHTMPLLCVSLAWVGGGTVWLGEKLSGWLASRSAAAAKLTPGLLTGLLVAACVLALLPRSLRPLHDHAEPVVRAAHWIGDHARPGDELLTNTSYGTFYSRVPGAFLGVYEAAPDSIKLDPSRPYRFVLLDRTAASFRPAWVEELVKSYQAVRIAGLPEDNPIVLELRGRQ